MNYYKYFIPVIIFLASCKEDTAVKTEQQPTKVEEQTQIPVIEYSVGAVLPHDTLSFTEGFLFYNSSLLESTGSPQGSIFKSVLGIVDQSTGKINVKAELDKTYFGEGIVVFKNKIYQVTYQTQKGFIYDAKTFKAMGQFSYPNKEGWGMTTDGEYIIMSDGTNILSYFDQDFKLVKTVQIKENGYAKDSLNELEFINGFIYANVWMSSDIVKIDPATGNVVARLNLAPLNYELKNFNPYALEMNGIAYDATNDKIYITGKAWPKIYEIRFKH